MYFGKNRVVLRGLWLFVLISVLPPRAAFASPNFNSANSRMEGCRPSPDKLPDFINGICQGEVIGVLNTDEKVCIPDGVTAGQAIRVVLEWLDRHPELQHLDFALLAASALETTWPCKAH